MDEAKVKVKAAAEDGEKVAKKVKTEGGEKVAEKTGKPGRPKTKPTKEGAAAKVVKKEDGVVEVKHCKALKPDRPLNAYTGTRFRNGTAQQLVFEMIASGAKGGKKVSEIKEELAKSTKENGCKFNLDAGYFPFVVASHPEFFRVVRKAGVEYVEMIKQPERDEKAIAAEEEKKAKAAAAREQKKAGGKDKPAKPGRPAKVKPAKEDKPVKPAKALPEDEEEDEEEDDVEVDDDEDIEEDDEAGDDDDEA